jgi:hypothetical protein
MHTGVLLCKPSTEKEIANMADKYFSAKAEAAGISGDDVNRRLRESRLGHAAPSDDWVQCKRIARCLWPDQAATVLHLADYYHYAPANAHMICG